MHIKIDDSELVGLVTTLTTIVNRLDSKVDQLVQHQGDVPALSAALGELNSRLTTELTSLQLRSDRDSTQLAKIQTTVTDSGTRIELDSRKLDGLQGQATSLGGQLDNALSTLSGIVTKLDTVITSQDELVQEGEKMSAEIDDLTAEVARDRTVNESAVTLLNGLSAQILSLQNDPAALRALASNLRSNSDALAAAVVTNTPAAAVEPPVVPPAEPPVDNPPVEEPA